MQKTTNNPTREQLADALGVVKRLQDIVAAYAPDFVHGVTKAQVLKASQRLLTDLDEFVPKPSTVPVSAEEFVKREPGRYDF